MIDIEDKIKQRGYWRVVVRPTKDFYIKDRFNISELKKVIESSKVQLSGWDYPHIEQNTPLIGQRMIGSKVDLEQHGLVESWQFSTAGHFAHVFAMREDYIIDADEATKIKSSFPFSKDRATTITKYFETVFTINRFTEIYLFASKLAQSPKFQDVRKFEVSVELHGVKDRLLFIWDPMRHLWEPYICELQEDQIDCGSEYSRDDLVASSNSLALVEIIKTFKLFNWEVPNEQAIKEDQRKLLERRL